MSNRIDFREVDDNEEKVEEVVEVEVEDKELKDDDGYEKFCYMCHRPESVVGKMIELPNDMHVCSECMNKSFEAMNNTPFDLGSLFNSSGVSFLNLGDLEGLMPKQQKVKKKKPGEPRKPIINIKDIPAPHKIKAQLDEYVVGQEYAKKLCRLLYTTITNVWQQIQWMRLKLKSLICL